MKLLLPIIILVLFAGCGSSDYPLPQESSSILLKGQSAKIDEDTTVSKNEENSSVSYFFIIDSDEQYIKVNSGSITITRN